MASLTATNAVTTDTDPTTAPQNASTDETNNQSLQQGDVKSGNPAQGTELHMWGKNGTPAQQFKLCYQ